MTRIDDILFEIALTASPLCSVCGERLVPDSLEEKEGVCSVCADSVMPFCLTPLGLLTDTAQRVRSLARVDDRPALHSLADNLESLLEADDDDRPARLWEKTPRHPNCFAGAGEPDAHDLPDYERAAAIRRLQEEADPEFEAAIAEHGEPTGFYPGTGSIAL